MNKKIRELTARSEEILAVIHTISDPAKKNELENEYDDIIDEIRDLAYYVESKRFL